MTKTMAEVLAGHQLKLGVRDMLLHCICGWSGSHSPATRGQFLVHQEAALTEAGFGLVAEALEEAVELIRPFSGIGMANGVTRAEVSAWLSTRAEAVRDERCQQPASAEIESEGRKLAAAILTRRLRKCIAEGAHQPDATNKCPRCGLPQAATQLQPHGQPPTETTTTTEGRTDTCHGPEWETPQRTTPPRSPSSNISLPTKGS